MECSPVSASDGDLHVAADPYALIAAPLRMPEYTRSKPATKPPTATRSRPTDHGFDGAVVGAPRICLSKSRHSRGSGPARLHRHRWLHLMPASRTSLGRNRPPRFQRSPWPGLRLTAPT